MSRVKLNTVSIDMWNTNNRHGTTEMAVYEGFLMQMQLQAQSLGNIVVRGLGVWVTLLAGMYLFG